MRKLFDLHIFLAGAQILRIALRLGGVLYGRLILLFELNSFPSESFPGESFQEGFDETTANESIHFLPGRPDSGFLK